ncbi:para-aminobenzoate synthase component I [Gracilibacillus halophilus YIM-C55.5]|uniref:Para-aminobenzoate synthase component I n=1 Tax=Gracilibacillus halophilus YIM-C55.5 TaxID=1308866 RepID=N4WQR4_9BACI|nr:aminodeoxychorismate synthase component I [Gracilibacillus halophilus]ENH96795.1 para-aminobenzoate synthase component I [Gracilibacillus halophilus YIM-C55.5]
MKETYLQFDFSFNEDTNAPLCFSHAQEVFQTNDLTDVTTIFQEIEQALNRGYYVAGFVSYEAAPAFHNHYKAHPSSQFPLVWFGVFDKPSSQVAYPQSNDYEMSNWQNTMSDEEYNEKISRIHQAIQLGDTYQVNFTTRLHANFSGNSYSLYQQLMQNQKAHYGAYLQIGGYHILSASPELFFQVKDGQLMTKPMKGTSKRGKTLEEDEYQKQKLYHSEKERAENVMIVDLLRNDVGKIANWGSVQVEKLFDIETYPTVHQMTSTIHATLKSQLTIYDWFQALFPCGSITGAPKAKTMEYIQALETTPRNVYCGAIGWISPNREAIFNVPIRTVTIDQENQTATYGTGGGVTWDSSSYSEQQELYQKAAILDQKRPTFCLLESMLLHEGSYPLLDEHLQRLSDSARYFQFHLQISRVKDQLINLARKHVTSEWKVRLLLYENGAIETSISKIEPIRSIITAQLAKQPVDEDNVFIYHKTTHRDYINQVDNDRPNHTFTSLLWNTQGMATEFTIGNLVVEKDGAFFTPPITDGLLPGIYRKHLLREKRVIEKSIPIDQLAAYDRIWFINSVRGWLPVELNI